MKAQSQGEQKWIRTSEQLPKADSSIEYSDDGITIEGTMSYLSHRKCMLAGVGGGNGYFGKGFATDGSTGCDTGLILDPPEFWRYQQLNPFNHERK